LKALHIYYTVNCVK